MKFRNKRFPSTAALLWLAIVPLALATPADVITSPTNLLLAPSDANPRNSEGDFIELKDGRALFVYTHFSSGANDYAKAHLAGRFSENRGATWDQEDTIIMPHPGGINIMSVSLLRLQDDSIALLYLHKVDKDECIPILLISTDEAQTWSKPMACITDPIGYYVVNNDRMIQLKSGRLIIPAARHLKKGEKDFQPGAALCTISDDGGKTWHMSKTTLTAPTAIRSGYQEPGVLELLDGRLLLWARTSGGAQYRSLSEDQGETWSPMEKTALLSPVSPATIERIPGRNDLLLVWNDHSDVDDSRKGRRTPLRAAISKDDGQTWHVTKTLENLVDGWYCYIAMDFVGDHVLLGYCSGDRREGNGLDTTKVTRIPIEDFYTNLASAPILKEN
jgi:sialidase-1